jgi:hypothetical protein
MTTNLNFAIDWLERNRDRAHAADCRSREPSAQCSCGLHRVLSGLRQTQNDAESAKTDDVQWLADNKASLEYQKQRYKWAGPPHWRLTIGDYCLVRVTPQACIEAARGLMALKT